MALIPKVEQLINDLALLQEGTEDYDNKLRQIWEEAITCGYIDPRYSETIEIAKSSVKGKTRVKK